MRWLLVVLVACSSKAPPPPAQPVVEPKPAAICTDGFVGGYAGTPECKVTAETPIRGADRSCTANEDCIRLGPHCAPFAIRADRTDAFSSVPCTDPGSGQCPPPCAAVCRDGCCVIPAGWGENCR